VERAELNKARNTCHGRSVFKIEDVVVINPCPHWNDAAWNGGQQGYGKSCVLPTVLVPKDMTGGHIDIAYNGSFIKRG
jgi:hypothetical protein